MEKAASFVNKDFWGHSYTIHLHIVFNCFLTTETAELKSMRP